jgi:hypothetical protein
MKYLTAAESAKRIGVNEKTIRLWIASGKLQAHHPQVNRLAIAESDVIRLANERSQYHDTARLTEDNRIAELESRVTTLEKQLAEMTATPSSSIQTAEYIATPRKRRTGTSEPNRVLPAGSMTVSQFGKLHQVPRGTFWGHVNKGINGDNPVQISKQVNPDNTDDIMYYIAPDDHQTIYSYWRKHRVTFQMPIEPDS